MKTQFYIRLFILITIIPLITISCSKKDDPEQEKFQVPYLKLENMAMQTYEVSAEQQIFSLKALTNRVVKTEVSLDCTWISVKDMITSVNSDVVEFLYNIEANTSEEQRIGYFSISPDDEDSFAFGVGGIVIEIIQAPNKH
jgi:hypothetical protein